jgi:hypothetical protein
MEFVLLHIPHIIPAFVAMGFLGRFVMGWALRDLRLTTLINARR